MGLVPVAFGSVTEVVMILLLCFAEGDEFLLYALECYADIQNSTLTNLLFEGGHLC
jgi:hypothetical protein